MTKKEAINSIKYRIFTASQLVGAGTSGKGFEDLYMAIQALEENQEYKAIGSVEEFKVLKEKAEPKELIIIEEKFNENNERIMIEWKCPVCGLNVIEEPPCQNYCQQCGNRLNWQGKE